MSVDAVGVRPLSGFQIQSFQEQNVSVLAPPAPGPTSGVSIAGMTALAIIAKCSDGTSTMNALGQFYGYWMPPNSSVWVQLQDAIFPINIGGLIQCGWNSTLISVMGGRFAVRPAGVMLTGGGTAVDLTYRVQS